MDDGETLTDAIKREMTEETGIPPTIGELLYVHQFTYEDSEQFEFFFHITNATDYLNIDMSLASHANKEIAEFGFVDPSATHILPKFLATENLAQHISDKAPVKTFSYMSVD